MFKRGNLKREDVKCSENNMEALKIIDNDEKLTLDRQRMLRCGFGESELTLCGRDHQNIEDGDAEIGKENSYHHNLDG